MLIYGTAWKRARTRELVRLALAQGFRAIDTANQLKHYDEAAVGAAIAEALSPDAKLRLNRDDLFIQTKFTHVEGQDVFGFVPYNARDDVAKQVESSLRSSLAHLRVSHVDSYVLHGPKRFGAPTLSLEDWDAWRAMESAHDAGTVRALGISNVSAPQLEELLSKARVKPAWVQNRCFAATGWDAHVRYVCAAAGVRYQGFSLLTANPGIVSHPRVARLAASLASTPEQIVFAFARQVGMVPLTGTTSEVHMRHDLVSVALQLDEKDVFGVDGIEGLGLVRR